MFFGIIMMITTGLLWTVVGIVMSNAAKNKTSASDILLITMGLALLFGLIGLGLDKNSVKIDQRTLSMLLVFMLTAGVVYVLGTLCVNRAMLFGHNGTVWLISQMALVMPFAMGIIVFKEKLSPTGGVGFGLIIMSLLLYGIKQKSGVIQANQIKISLWLQPALAAFLLCGLTQCFCNLPSYWRLPEQSMILRGTLFQTGATGVLAIMFAIKPHKISRNSIKPALFLAVAWILSLYLLFFQGLDRLAQIGVGAIGYPLAIGSCVLGFSFYSIFVIREKASTIQYAGLIVGTLGIIMISTKL